MRSLATRQANLALSQYVGDAVSVLKAAGYDLIILETSGIGQSDTEIIDHSDVSLYVMTRNTVQHRSWRRSICWTSQTSSP